jgi:hypothetical protein
MFVCLCCVARLRSTFHSRVFAGFVEAPINFAPTYKYRVGTNTYSFAPLKGQSHAAQDASDNKEAISQLSEGQDSSKLQSAAKAAAQVSAKAQKKQDKKRRAPAWCDRVLYFGRARLDVNNMCDALDALEGVRVSGRLTTPALVLTHRMQHARMLTHLAMAYYSLPAYVLFAVFFGLFLFSFFFLVMREVMC